MKKGLNFLFIILISQVSCSEKSKQKSEITGSKPEKIVTSDSTSKDANAIETATQTEVFDVNEMLFNGERKRFFSLKQFEATFGKADSIKLMSEEEPCSYIFENPDGSKDLDDKYLYKSGSRFENNKDQVAIDEFRFSKTNFLKYKNVILNSSTTVNDLKKLFPNAVREMSSLNFSDEGAFEVIQLREDENNVSDGHINIFIKKGKLHSMHWWFPC